jgi:hypothetical protein
MTGQKPGANRYLYMPDPLGSVNHLLDMSRNVAGTYVYAPYGEVQSDTGAGATYWCCRNRSRVGA